MKNIQNAFWTIFLLGIAACNNSNEQTVNKESVTSEQEVPVNQVDLSREQIKNAQIKTGHLRQETLAELVNANGLIQLPPNDRASINAPYESFIDKIYFMEGQKVKRGDILVALQHPNFIRFQQEYQQVYSQFEYLQKELERQKILRDSLVTAEKKYQQTLSDFEIVRSQNNALAEKLKLIGINPAQVAEGTVQSIVYIRAPFNGIVTNVNGYKGQSVLPEKPIMEIMNVQKAYLKLNVFETNIGKVEQGQKVSFAVSSLDSSRVYSARISSVGRSLDLASRTIRVNTEFSWQPKLIPGLYVEAQIHVHPRAAWVLPEEAVILEQDSSYVFVQLSDTLNENSSNEVAFRKTLVKTGLRNSGLVQIKEEGTLERNSSIVIQGANYLKSEMNKGEGDED